MNDTTTRLERASHVVLGERCELRIQDGELRITKETVGQEPTAVRIPAAHVRGATLERPSRGQPGWLHLAVIGGSPAPTSDLGAALDPYTLPVTTRTVAAAKRVVRLVTQHVQERGLPPEPSTGGGRTSTSVIVTAPAGVDARTATPPPPVPPPGAAAEGADTDRPAEATTRASADAGTGTATDADTDLTADAADAGSGTLVTTLRELADLHAAGALTDEEFERAKAQVLDGR
jgi:hypothetical protein